MGLDDLVNKGKDFLETNKDKINEALKSEQAEQISDTVLEKGEAIANKVTGDKFADQVGDVKANIDKAVGTE